MTARHVAFPKASPWSFIEGKGFSLGSSRFSSLVGSFLPLRKLYKTAVAIITVGLVDSFVRMDMERERSNLFQNPEHPLYRISRMNLG